MFMSRCAVLALGLSALSACAEHEGPFTEDEWSRLESLADLPEPPADPSNKYVGNAAAIAIGKKFYFDPQFSGKATTKDMLGRDIPIARAARGVDVEISCNTCHQVTRGGADHTSSPGHVSIGVGAYDVNGMQTVNSAYYKLIYWNGRNDSLWAQIIAVNESAVSMGSNRLKNFWRIRDAYADEYNAVFTGVPLPTVPTLAEQKARIDATTGQCKLDINSECPVADGQCAVETDATTNTTGCWPKWPLQGRPGATAGCQRGSTKEPFGDAFDCMAAADSKAITQVYVHFAKAIAAYEYTLLSRNSPFDKYVAAGADSTHMSPAAIRGARLFVGKASCVDCHNTPLLSDNYNSPDNLSPGFHNVGVPQVGTYVPSEMDCPDGGTCDCVVSEDAMFGPAKNCLPWGIADGFSKLKTNAFRRDKSWSDDMTDGSRATFYYDDITGETPMVTPVPADFRGMWKTPSLRDVAITGPYMHNGMYTTLTEVVWHYNQGGVGSQDVPGEVDARIRPLGLTDAEVADLVEFLNALTGEALPTEVVGTPTLPARSAF